MNSDDRFWVSIWSIIAVGVVTLVFIAAAYNYHTDKLFVGAGYTQTTLPGVQGARWVKVAK